MSDDERTAEEGGLSEVAARMAEESRRRKERNEEELREYEELRRVEKEKEAEEIKLLRERKEQRKLKREEFEKKQAAERAEEEARRRAEDEERQRKKREEEQRKREERERKAAEFSEMKNASNRPNFIINKKATNNVEAVEETKPEEVQKSKEQLEAERKAILEQRIPTLNIDGLKGDALKAEAKKLYDSILRLEGDKYDLEQRFTRQSYDMQELAERARQMAKGEKKSTKVQSAENDPLAAKFHGCPNKVIMFSAYERVKDHRTFDDRQKLFTGPLYVEAYERIAPKANVVMTEEGFKVDESAPAPAAPAAPPAEEVAVEE